MMTARLVLIAAGLLALSGVPGLFLSRRSMIGQKIATAMAVLGSIIGLAASLTAPTSENPIQVSTSWTVAGGAFSIQIDGLSDIFLLPVFLMAGLGSVYGMEYWRQLDHPANGRKLRLFYGLLSASLVLVAIAQNGILFLCAWEVMALSAFFLVTTEDEVAAVRRAGWVYLVATHVGTLLLFAFFALLHHVTGSFDFSPIDQSTGIGATNWLFILAVAGFGLKAGIMPLHIWLPAAHANAPSHVSAFLSGVLLKIGIYGLMRVCSLLPLPPVSWGVALLALGAISALVGVAFALAQHDLKRLLAYHSIENIGIIVMGLGLAMIGRALNEPVWIVLGLAGALLHVWNHALFKSLLFFGAGSVIHGVGTRDIDRMGGLAQRMPHTALLFTIGAVAICGLPPLNGFVSELLVYLGLFRTLGIDEPLRGRVGASFTGAALAVPVLAVTGALAVACFVKVIGAVFLGHPRGRARTAVRVHESPRSMLAPMIMLAACCVVLGLAPSLAAPLLQRAMIDWAGRAGEDLPLLTSVAPFGWISAANAGLIVLSLLVWVVVIGLARRRAVQRAGTWDCGFVAPLGAGAGAEAGVGAIARIQYTASSFAQMLVGLLAFILRPREHRPHLRGPFPHEGSAEFKSHVDDVVLDRWILPALRLIESWFMRVRVLQHGRAQLYVLYVLGALILMLLATFPVYERVLELLSR
jgi:hydrogenase-4 component B